MIAESDRAVVVAGNHYVPPEDVHRECLEPSACRTTCPWKGRAAYHDVVVDGKRNPAAAWFHPSPTPAAARIRDHVAFRHGVKIRPTPQG